MTAYTSAASGDFNTNATWVGGAGHPTSSADTVSIAAGHNISVALGDTATCGALAFVAGVDTSHRTTFTNNGTFNMAGAWSLTANNAIVMGAGSVFDLNGNTLTATGNTVYNFTGTAGSHVTIQSTGTQGTWTYSGGTIVSTWIYVDVSGFLDAYFGRGNGNAGIQSYQYCTFTNMRLVSLDDVNNTADGGFLIDHCDFRNPNRSNTADVQPFVSLNANNIGANIRQVSNCTWYSSGNIGYFNILARGTTFRNNVVVGYRSACATATSTQVWQDSFFSMHTGDLFASAIGFAGILTFQRNYCYYIGPDHPTSGWGSTTTATTVTFNVFEATDGTPGDCAGVNWFLYGALGGYSITFRNNIHLGEGNAIDQTGAASQTFDISNNTYYINNLGLGTDPMALGDAFSYIIDTEQSGAYTGTINVYNNLCLVPDYTVTPVDTAIALKDATADQIDLFDYCVGWSYGSSTCGKRISPPVNYQAASVVITAGLNPHGFSVDPLLVDRARNIAKWDKFLGGPGTGAHAIAELIKMNGTGGTWNPNYDPVNLVNYVQRGFTARNSALIGSGYQGGNIGAFVAPPSGNAPDRLRLGAS